MITNGMKEINIFTESDIPFIKKLFNSEVENFLKISHFTVIVITPNKRVFLVSSSKNFSEKYNECGFHRYDNTLCPLMYENLDFYTWSEGYVKFKQKETAHMKKMYGLNNGTVFVRKVAEYTLLYTVATKEEDPIMKTIFVNHANSILRIGDYVYNELTTGLGGIVNDLFFPKIETFKPFLDRDIPSLASYEFKRRNEIIELATNKQDTQHPPKLKLVT